MQFLAALLLLVSSLPVFSQDVKSTLLKHLKTSREFTLKVAEAMPEDAYDFKLSAPQMTFAEQMIHIAQAQDFFLSYLAGEKMNEAKPESKSKPVVIAFLQASFDTAVARVEAATSEKLRTTFKTDDGSLTGLELILGDLDHTTHHRASAEMYLRAKGIKPPEYKF